MGLFSTSPPDADRVATLEQRADELHRELAALRERTGTVERLNENLQREIAKVDLHARAIVEEAKRLINKFERRLDREAAANGDEKGPQSSQDAPGSTIPRAVAYDRPYPLYGGPTPTRRNY